MSEVVEGCGSCGWESRTRFRYHGGVPVVHPICPVCGGQLAWSFQFDEAEVAHAPDEMLTFISSDEVGFPEDNSPEVSALRTLIAEVLEAWCGSALPLANVDGVVDLEFRPYITTTPPAGRPARGVKLIANVGRSVYSMALLELLSVLRHTFLSETVSLIAYPNTYGLPEGATELLPFGTEVGLFAQCVVSESSLQDGSWLETYTYFSQVAVRLAERLVSTARMAPEALSGDGHREVDVLESTTPITDLIPDEFGSPFEPILLERARQTVLEPLLAYEHQEEELASRLDDFLEALQLDAIRDEQGELVFSLDSARVHVGLERRDGRLLVRYRSVILTEIPIAETEDINTISSLMTSLNNQLVFGRCVLEPLPGQGTMARVTLEKTLLAMDIDLSEFIVTLVFMAEESDRIDNFLQEGLGGLRADQYTAAKEANAAPLEAIVRRFSTVGIEGVEKFGVEHGTVELRHLLEEVRLPIKEHPSGDLAFSYGSSRIRGRVWEDERATYLTLRATVLRNLERIEMLSDALNQCNREIHFGAFVLRDGELVEMVETILIDDLSIEEFIHALVTLGELADRYDNFLQERFGGELGGEDFREQG